MIHIGDNLEVMRSMESASVDLIATDPPFNTGRDFGAYVDSWKYDINREMDYYALGEDAQVAVDAAYRLHSESMAAFCCFLGVRLVEMHRILKPSGSIYLHCDQTANSYIRILMDAVFGSKNQRNEIAWCYTGPGSPAMKQFNRKHDTIYWYCKSEKDWTFNKDAIRIPHKRLNRGGYGSDGNGMTDKDYEECLQRGKVPETWWSKFSPVGRLHNERIGYPTQKPIALYSRIIQASCPEKGWVLDPFAGSGTTLVAAHRLGRCAIGIDVNPESKSILEERLRGA